jgi:hypothetical protein
VPAELSPPFGNAVVVANPRMTFWAPFTAPELLPVCPSAAEPHRNVAVRTYRVPLSYSAFRAAYRGRNLPSPFVGLWRTRALHSWDVVPAKTASARIADSRCTQVSDSRSATSSSASALRFEPHKLTAYTRWRPVTERSFAVGSSERPIFRGAPAAAYDPVMGPSPVLCCFMFYWCDAGHDPESDPGA